MNSYGYHKDSFESNEKQLFSDLSIVTFTEYNDDNISNIRYPLALRFFQNCEELGIKTIVADSSSNSEYLEKLSGFKNIHILYTESSFGKKQRQCLKEALYLFKTDYFLLIEPEKYNMINPTILEKLIFELKEKNVNIVVPKRTRNEQLPNFFERIEGRLNRKILNKFIKNDEYYDLMFGPKAFDYNGLQYFLKYNEFSDKIDSWDFRILPVISAINDGICVSSVDTNYEYDPTEIKIEDTRQLKEKRLLQYKTILQQILQNNF